MPPQADGGGELLQRHTARAAARNCATCPFGNRKILTCSPTVIADPEDKNFDLEAYLNSVSAEST